MSTTSLHRWSTRFVWLVIFLLPWQTRWIIHIVPVVQNQGSEYGTISLYVTMILVAMAGLLCWYGHQGKKNILQARWLLLWLMWLAFAAIWSTSPMVSWYYLLLTFGAILYYLIGRTVKPIVIASSLAITGCVQAMMALWQWTVAYVYPNTWLGLAEHDPLVQGQSVIITSAGRILRAYGSLPHPNILAGLLVVSIMSVTIWYWLDRHREKPRPTILFIVASALLFLGLFVTFSRAGLLAIVVWLVVILASSLWSHHWKLAQVIRSSIILLLLMIISGNYITQGLILHRADMTERLEIVSAAERVAGWGEAVGLLFFPQILIGVGPGAYIWAAAEQFPGRQSYQYQPTHLSYLLALVELGLIGLWLLIVVITNTIVWPKLKTEEWCLALGWIAALVTFGFFDHWLWSSYAGLSIIWLSLAFISGLATHKKGR